MKLQKFIYNAVFLLMISAALILTIINLNPYLQFFFRGSFDVILTGIICLITGGIAACFLSVLFHETGHMLFSKFSGFKIASFRLFNRETIYLNGRITTKKIKNNFSYGSCELINTKEENIKKRFFIVTTGGIIFSFLIFITYLLLNVFLNNVHPYIYVFFCMGMLISLYILLSSLLPSEIKGTHTDGAIIFGLTKDKDYTKVLIALLKIQAQLYGGKTPSEIDKDLYFNVPLLSDDHISMMQLYYLRYFYYLDFGDNVKAAETDRRILQFIDIMPIEEVTKLYLNIVFDLIISGNENEKAKATYKFIEERLGEDITTLRIKAYYSTYINKNKEKTEEYINKAKELNKDESLSGMYKMEMKLLDNIKQS